MCWLLFIFFLLFLEVLLFKAWAPIFNYGCKVVKTNLIWEHSVLFFISPLSSCWPLLHFHFHFNNLMIIKLQVFLPCLKLDPFELTNSLNSKHNLSSAFYKLTRYSLFYFSSYFLFFFILLTISSSSLSLSHSQIDDNKITSISSLFRIRSTRTNKLTQLKTQL